MRLPVVVLTGEKEGQRERAGSLPLSLSLASPPARLVTELMTRPSAPNIPNAGITTRISESRIFGVSDLGFSAFWISDFRMILIRFRKDW